MTTPPAQFNEYVHVGEPARVPLERLGWTYTPRETLQSLKASATAALLLGQVRVGTPSKIKGNTIGRARH